MENIQPLQERDTNIILQQKDVKMQKYGEPQIVSGNDLVLTATKDGNVMLGSQINMSQAPSQDNFSAHNKNFLPMENKLSKLEDQLYSYLFKNLSQSEMSNINKFFLVPIGLPGMGKSTLSRFLSATSQKYFNKVFNHNIQQINQQQFPKIQNFQKRSKFDANGQIQSRPIKIEFLKISYDRILTQNAEDYMAVHQCDMNTAIDIIRDKADQEYLDTITLHCQSLATNENSQNNFLVKQIIYLDRNNTADVWPDIQKTIQMATAGHKIKSTKSVLIVPESHPDFRPSDYNTMNPICPQMMFECIKRIFGRPAHDCLSSANKPKVVEVILKFAKLYDGVDLSDDNALKTYFDDFVRLDFLQFSQRANLHPDTIKTLIEGYNQTPPNFQCPSDETIEKCIKAVEFQIDQDNQNDQQMGQ